MSARDGKPVFTVQRTSKSVSFTVKRTSKYGVIFPLFSRAIRAELDNNNPYNYGPYTPYHVLAFSVYDFVY